MLVAVRADHRRTGLGRVLTESVVSEMQHEGVSTVRWLVHPQNVASLAFSRSVFPEADETYPPEDRPYVVFMLALVTNEAYFTAKIGVTTTTAKYGRIETHENAGWLLRGRWATTTADEAVTIEQTVISWWRTTLHAPVAMTREQMPTGGWTETASLLWVDIDITKARIQTEVNRLAAETHVQF
jgi:hypothetical protein